MLRRASHHARKQHSAKHRTHGLKAARQRATKERKGTAPRRKK